MLELTQRPLAPLAAAAATHDDSDDETPETLETAESTTADTSSLSEPEESEESEEPEEPEAPGTDQPESEETEAEEEHETLLALGFPAASFRNRLRDETGAVTAEYALIIMAGVAFAGALILIMRSEEVRAMLLSLVQNALQTAG